MTFGTTGEFVEYKILIQAVQAMQSLRELNMQATSFQQKVAAVQTQLKQFSTQTGLSMKSATSVFKEFDMIMDESGKGSLLFGQMGKQGWTEVGNAAQSNFQKVFSSVNAMRIALGAFIAMLLFQAIQAVTQFVRSSIEEFTELEDSMWRLNVAEKALSEQGIEISMDDFREGIEEIRKLLPIFSEQDISGMVGKIAISTKELGYTKDQIIALSKSIAILNVVSTENEDINQTAGKVITALLSGTTKGVSGLGVQLNDTVIKAKAMEMNFLDAGESLDDLTKREKDLVKLQIVLDTGNDSLLLAGDYLETNSAKIKENSASVDDLKTAWGGFVTAVIPAFTPLVELLTAAVNSFKAFSVLFDVVKTVIANIVISLGTGANAIDAIRKGIIAFKDIPKIFDAVAGKEIPSLFTKVPENAPNWFKNLFGKYLTDVDTATDKTKKFEDALVEFDSDTFKQKIEDILEDAQNARDDLAEKLGQKKEDIDLEYQRKALDAERDYNRKVEDINRDAEREIAALKDKQRQEDLRAEEDYQNKLWELRMRYLMDLEEALHARDARQVIRLQKQYEIDKEALLRKKGLDDKQREEDQRDQLADIELKRQQRLEDAQREYEEKLYDQRLAKQRELDDLNVWYQREQDDLEKSIQRKLQALIDGYIDEKKITEQNAAEVYGILYKYFGPGGMTDALYAYMASKLATPIPIPVMSGYSLGGGLATSSTSSTGGTTGGRTPTTSTRPRGSGEQMAEGGTLVASRPTTVTFGEAGLEMAQFTPLSRLGRDTNKVFGSMGNNGINGQIAVELFLSPDLEARVINASLDGVAEVVTKINRTKL